MIGCNRNLILPIAAPILSYLALKYSLIGSSEPRWPFWVIGQPECSSMKEDQEEMARWSSSPNLLINNPDYNPFIQRVK